MWGSIRSVDAPSPAPPCRHGPSLGVLRTWERWWLWVGRTLRNNHSQRTRPRKRFAGSLGSPIARSREVLGPGNFPAARQPPWDCCQTARASRADAFSSASVRSPAFSCSLASRVRASTRAKIVKRPFCSAISSALLGHAPRDAVFGQGLHGLLGVLTERLLHRLLDDRREPVTTRDSRHRKHAFLSFSRGNAAFLKQQAVSTLSYYAGKPRRYQNW